jgi:hypothetical protein
MNPKMASIIKPAIYALAVVLALAALWLVLNTPVEFLNNHPVYQGF